MTYNEWAEEYLKEAEKIQEKITALKEYRETAPLPELKSIENRLRVLYQMYLDCIHTARTLTKKKGVASGFLNE